MTDGETVPYPVYHIDVNKAFVREPDDVDTRCPRCHIIGQPVARHTVLAHLPSDAAARLSDSASFCANPRKPSR